MVLPEYINCQRKGEIITCEFYMHPDCPETCDYALDIKGVGIGAMTEPPEKTGIKKTLDDLSNGGLTL